MRVWIHRRQPLQQHVRVHAVASNRLRLLDDELSQRVDDTTGQRRALVEEQLTAGTAVVA
jgi:hypothetical protein